MDELFEFIGMLFCLIVVVSLITIGARNALSDSNPGPYYVFAPKEDITAFELAKTIEIICGDKPCQVSADYPVKHSRTWDVIGRNFYPVK